MPFSLSRPCRLSRSPRAVALGLAATLTALSACSSGDAAPGSANAPSVDAALAPARAAITADGLMAHTKALSDDSLEGRAPATPGEDKTVAYLQSQFAAMGLKGGMPDGSFVQNAAAGPRRSWSRRAWSSITATAIWRRRSANGGASKDWSLTLKSSNR